MSTDLDLLDDSESLGVVTHRPVGREAAADSEMPRPRWHEAAERAIAERRRLGQPVTQTIPPGMYPDNGAAGMSASQLEEAQARAGALGGQLLNRVLRSTYGATFSVPSPADALPEPKSGGGPIKLGGLWTALKSLFGRG